MTVKPEILAFIKENSRKMRALASVNTINDDYMAVQTQEIISISESLKEIIELLKIKAQPINPIPEIVPIDVVKEVPIVEKKTTVVKK